MFTIPSELRQVLLMILVPLFLGSVLGPHAPGHIGNMAIPRVFRKRNLPATAALLTAILVLCLPSRIVIAKNETPIRVVSILNDETLSLIEKMSAEQGMLVDFVRRVPLGASSIDSMLDGLDDSNVAPQIVVGGAYQSYAVYSVLERHLQPLPDELRNNLETLVGADAVGRTYLKIYKGHLAFAYNPADYPGLRPDLLTWVELVQRLQAYPGRLVVPMPSRHAGGTVLAEGLYEQLSENYREEPQRIVPKFAQLLEDLAAKTECFRSFGHPDMQLLAQGKVSGAINWEHDLRRESNGPYRTDHLVIATPQGTPWEFGIAGILKGGDTPGVRKLLQLLASREFQERDAALTFRYPIRQDATLPQSLRPWEALPLRKESPDQDPALLRRIQALAQQHLSLPDAKACSIVFSH